MKNTLKYILGALIISLVTTQAALAADPWPASTSGTQIGSGLTTLNTTGNGFEASGLEYLDGYGYIAIGDDGDLAVLNGSGSVLKYSALNGDDIEDVTITDTTATDYKVYIANEGTNKIEEFLLSTTPNTTTVGTVGAKTGKSWTLSDLPISGPAGFEALAYVPAADAPASWGTAQSGGFFLAASQAEKILHVYTFDRNSSSSVSDVTTIILDPTQSYYDIGALNYNTSTDLLYVVFDGADKLKEFSLTGVEINSYQLPTYLQSIPGSVDPYSDEGFVIVPNCSTGLAQVALGVDNISSRITVYSNYPITCPTTAPTTVDADSDGYNSDVDCNDADSSVHSSITYYRDADSDGLGISTTTTSVCSTTVPSGYVTNASDSNDSDFDNDGVSTGTDCNDADSSITANQTYYQDADADGLGSATVTTSVCSYTVPTGYVTNSSDANDSDYDNDGVSTSLDCNDSDSAISSNQTYYRDADNDGLGSATVTTSVCSYTVPTGYVTNASDSNDSDFDNDGVSTGTDCNDADSTISAYQTYYRDADSDGMGNPSVTTSVCSYTVPSGYVTNATDTDDTQAPVTATVPSVPTNLTMQRLALRKVKMSWTGDGTYYNLKLTDTSTNKTTTFGNITSTSKTADSKYIQARHTYSFTVQACNTQGCSAYSSSKAFTTYSQKQWRKIKSLHKHYR